MTPYCKGCPYTLICFVRGYPAKIHLIKAFRAEKNTSLATAKRWVEAKMRCYHKGTYK